MLRLLIRAVLAAACAAVIGAGAAVIAYARHPAVVLEMDRDRPSFVSGLYTGERDGDLTFAWSGEQMVVRLEGLDRRTAWSCVIRVRGARSDPATLPNVTIAVDGDVVTTTRASNDYADVVAVAPGRSGQQGLTLALTSTPTFRPGGGDPRELGVQIDRLVCQPDRAWAWPPLATVASAAIAGAAIGAAIVFAGASVAVSLVAATLLGLAHAYLLSTGGAVFSAFPDTMVWLAVGAALAIALIGQCLSRVAHASSAAILALVLVAGSGYLKLLALVHPAKPLVDALFQAHRLDWVLAGRYFFTQPLPDGVAFPYAIGLYVVAAPWARMIADHVALLRGVVSVADAIAAGLVYLMVTRAWRDRATGVVAAALVSLVPLPYGVVGNGNLTNAFGQSIAMVALALVAAGVMGCRIWSGAMVVTIVVTVALLSHVSTLALLVPTLAATALMYRVLGGRALTGEAWRLAGVTTLAVILSAGLYYLHFTDVYRDALVRIRASASAPVVSGEAGRVGSSSTIVNGNAPAAVLTRQLSWWERASDVVDQTSTNIGWPILLLAAAGAWRTIRAGQRDRLSLLLLAWIGIWLVFVVAGTLTRVDTQYQRYASEFVGRVNLATYPAAAILAARGAAWPWASGGFRSWWLRAATGALCLAAAGIGARAWMGWLQ